jgi:Zn-dependent protease with chaperone function
LASPWRPPRIEIRLEIATQGRSSDGLRSERAHVLRPDSRRYFARSLVATRSGPWTWRLWAHGRDRPVARPYALAGRLGFWFAGTVLMSAGVCRSAWASHRRELRADALAAELLGDNGPVGAMLDGCQARHERLERAARLSSLPTHPCPTRRRRELLPADGEGGSARARSEAIR